MTGDKFRFSIDRGGTFTDVIAFCPAGKVRVVKLLSEDPTYEDAPREAIRRILEEETGVPHPRVQPVNTTRIEWIRMGTTVATNALLERKGDPMALVITKGFSDALEIGNQQRPKIFDLTIEKPDLLYKKVIEVEERVILKREDDQRPRTGDPDLVRGISGDILEIEQHVNVPKLRRDLQEVLDSGIRSIAVVLMHSYTYPNHEMQVGRIAEEMGFTNVSLSCQVMPMIRFVPRGQTAEVDAYLTPCIKAYLDSFSKGFENNLEGVSVLFMRSDGGLTPMDEFIGSQAIISGPAGGVVGYSRTAFSEDEEACPVIGYDMGGTSTDVSRFAGEYDHTFESVVSGVSIQVPQLDIQTVAAGGGSQLFFRSGLFVVGPESAGANPGPACYKRGGPLTVTDANAVLGRLLPEFFPKIFGSKRDEALDINASLNLFQALTDQINDYYGNTGSNCLTVEEVADGFIKVANESMARPIRNLTQARGFDPSAHVLACFGGAGGQHACDIAATLGIKKVIVHRYSSVLSAYGIALADVVHEESTPFGQGFVQTNHRFITSKIGQLIDVCRSRLETNGFKDDQIQSTVYLNMRYERTDCALMVPSTQNFVAGSDLDQFAKSFVEQYKREFGFTLPDRTVIVDDIRVRSTGKAVPVEEPALETAKGQPVSEKVVKVYFSDRKGYLDTNIYNLDKLAAGHSVNGPAIIANRNTTILVAPGCDAVVNRHGSVVIHLKLDKQVAVGTQLDPIQLAIFGHRFMSIAEQMGRILQRTAISTNIKERLDFSCALFGPDGGLVSNAPHIPVHLGAMQEAVQYQMNALRGQLSPGDVILTNHPKAGGSHLPDLTVITPVFLDGQVSVPAFFVANRGHHADIGGLTPGSMPPNSTTLQQEGAVFVSFKVVKNGVFQEKVLVDALRAPEKNPGCSGTRNLPDNLADLHAQIAANQKGIDLVLGLIKEYTLEVVQSYMAHIQAQAEFAVRDLLKTVAQNADGDDTAAVLQAEDRMDDGSTISLTIRIEVQTGDSVWDFDGTSPQVWGNLNAPRAITLSAIIYCLRSMVDYDIPLNQGCLKPVHVIIPKHCLLDPDENAAVVGANVLTSQRIVDVILKAFRKCAASQGCMNNITYGNDAFGYYETVAGGAGASATWHGASGVHTHMTNTRITDPEILEKRYPVILKRFSLNRGSGGRGAYNGGDGVVRETVFRVPLTLSILTERRVFRPYGLEGGEDGASGQNHLVRVDGQIVNIGAKNAIPVQPGDSFRLLTPGGGGYGSCGALPAKTRTTVPSRQFDINRFVPDT